MGSWNETCFLTGLAIRPGDKCRIIILQRKGYGFNSGGMCYIDDAYFMKSMPLLGTYADYGEIENLDENCVFTKSTLETLQKTTIPVKEDSYQVEFFEPKDGTIYQFLSAIERGQVLAEDSYMKNYGVKEGMPENGEITIKAKDSWDENSQLKRYLGFISKKASYIVPVGLIMILEDAYQATSKSKREEYKKYNSETHQFEKTSIEDTCFELIDSFKRVAESNRKWNELNKESTEDIKPNFNDMILFKSEIESIMGPFLQREINLPELEIINKVIEGKDITKDCMEIARMVHFRIACNKMRKAFFPCAGKGSQMDFEQFPIIDVMMDATKNIIETRKNENRIQKEEEEKS